MLEYRFKKFLKYRFFLIKEIKPFLNKFNEILSIKLNKLNLNYTHKKYKNHIILKIETKIQRDVLATLAVLEYYKLITTLKTFGSLIRLYKYLNQK